MRMPGGRAGSYIFIMSTTAQQFAQPRVRLGNFEPAVVSLLKQLDPLLVVASLFGCELALGDRLTPSFGALALLTYIISAKLLGHPAVSAAAGLSHAEFSRSYTRILLQWAGVIGLLLLAAFALKVSELFSRKLFLTWFIATPVVLLGTHTLRRRTRWWSTNATDARRYIVVGVNEVSVELVQRLPPAGLVGYFDFRSDQRVSPLLAHERLTGHCRDVASFVRTHAVQVVYITLPLANVPRLAELVNALRDTTASVYFVPNVFAFDVIQGRLVEINGMPALSVCETPLQGMGAVGKRALDLVLALLGLVLLAPLMLLIALLIKLTSRGPVLFRQRRYGLDGEEIQVYKFRSMRVCENGAQIAQARPQDPRVTPLGAMLRKSSLDELPQLFNVLQGTMSLVGPRPHAVAHNEQYRRLINGYMIRHKVRPGITGLAQVHGLRGETDTLEKMAARVRYDLEYLRNWSPWLDVWILCRTLLVLVHDRRNAY